MRLRSFRFSVFFLLAVAQFGTADIASAGGASSDASCVSSLTVAAAGTKGDSRLVVQWRGSVVLDRLIPVTIQENTPYSAAPLRGKRVYFRQTTSTRGTEPGFYFSPTIGNKLILGNKSIGITLTGDPKLKNGLDKYVYTLNICNESEVPTIDANVTAPATFNFVNIGLRTLNSSAQEKFFNTDVSKILVQASYLSYECANRTCRPSSNPSLPPECDGQAGPWRCFDVGTAKPLTGAFCSTLDGKYQDRCTLLFPESLSARYRVTLEAPGFHPVTSNWFAQRLGTYYPTISPFAYFETVFPLAKFSCKTNPTTANDKDNDGIAAICDGDDDGDSTVDGLDNCPNTNSQNRADSDGDGIGDVCDNCGNVKNPLQQNSDADTFGDSCDNCPTMTNPDQLNTDPDTQGNVCDTDDDNDGDLDTADNCTLVANSDQLNTDKDTQGNVCDTDDDNDGDLDTADNCPLAANPDQLNTDKDTMGNVCDTDDDNDGDLDTADNCPLEANSDQLNTDKDTQGNVCDTDDDNDADLDTADNCPLVANQNQSDVDGDRIGDVCDPRDDRTCGFVRVNNNRAGSGVSFIRIYNNTQLVTNRDVPMQFNGQTNSYDLISFTTTAPEYAVDHALIQSVKIGNLQTSIGGPASQYDFVFCSTPQIPTAEALGCPSIVRKKELLNAQIEVVEVGTSSSAETVRIFQLARTDATKAPNPRTFCLTQASDPHHFFVGEFKTSEVLGFPTISVGGDSEATKYRYTYRFCAGQSIDPRLELCTNDQ